VPQSEWEEKETETETEKEEQQSPRLKSLKTRLHGPPKRQQFTQKMSTPSFEGGQLEEDGDGGGGSESDGSDARAPGAEGFARFINDVKQQVGSKRASNRMLAWVNAESEVARRLRVANSLSFSTGAFVRAGKHASAKRQQEAAAEAKRATPKHLQARLCKLCKDVLPSGLEAALCTGCSAATGISGALHDRPITPPPQPSAQTVMRR